MIAASAEHDPGRPARPVRVLEQQPDEQRDRREPQQRQRVRDLPHGRGDGVDPRFHPARSVVAAGGSVVGRDRRHPPARLRQQPQPRVSARAARPGGRDRLLDVARRDARGGRPRDARLRQRRTTPDVYREMLAAGYTAVGEFHYLGAAEALRRRRGGRRRPGSRSCCSTSHTSAAASTACASRVRRRLPRRGRVAPRRRNRRRRRPPLRARLLARAGSRRSARYAARERAATPHPRRRAAARDRGVPRRARLPPDRALGRHGLPDEQTTIVHATHANDEELDLLAATGARICACPTTEADLGDGFLRVTEVLDRVDPALHRLGLQHADRPARGAPRARGHRAPPDGPPRDPDDRAAARDRLGRGRARPAARGRGPRSRSTWTTASLAGVAPEHVEAALIAGCAADVCSSGRR